MIYKLCLHHIALNYITLKPDNRHIKLNTFILLENADRVQEYFGALIHTLIVLQIHRIQDVYVCLGTQIIQLIYGFTIALHNKGIHTLIHT